jgi:hypothetical protein
MSIRRLSLLISGILLVLALPAAAQITSVWSTADGVFSASKNWTPKDTPLPSDAVFFRTNLAYTVTFDNEESSANLRVETGTVTFNMNGNIYHAGRGLQAGVQGDDSIVINNATLIVTNGGQLRTDMLDYQDSSLIVSNGGVLKVTGGSQVWNVGGGYCAARLSGGKLVIDGPESAFVDCNSYGADFSGEVIVQNGGTFRADGYPGGMGSSHALPGGPARLTVTGTGSRAIMRSGVFTSYGGNICLVVTNGAEVTLGNGFNLIGNSGALNQNTVRIGGPGEAALVVSSGAVNLAVGTLWGGVGHLVVLSNGTLRVLGGGLFIGDGPTGYDRTSDTTLDHALIQMASNLVVDVQRDSSADHYVPTLRGVGTIERCTEGPNFAIRNDGWIKPGDLATNQLAIGALTVTGGDLFQTNKAAPTAGLYFKFNEASCDQILLGGGLAQITTGSNVFALAAGAQKPIPKQKYGLGEYNFIIATNLTYQPSYDNLVPLLTKQCGLKEGEDFRYGVVTLADGRNALQLAFTPSKSVIPKLQTSIPSSLQKSPRSWTIAASIALAVVILLAGVLIVWWKKNPGNREE